MYVQIIIQMDIKLTLKLDSYIIQRAKMYAEEKNTSLSKLIETYLNLITDPKVVNEDVTPFVKSISGVVDLPKNYDPKKDYKKHILKKYSK